MITRPDYEDTSFGWFLLLFLSGLTFVTVCVMIEKGAKEHSALYAAKTACLDSGRDYYIVQIEGKDVVQCGGVR